MVAQQTEGVPVEVHQSEEFRVAVRQPEGVLVVVQRPEGAQVNVSRTQCEVVADSGHTRTLVHRDCCGTWMRRENAVMWTVTDQRWRRLGTTTLVIKPKAGRRGAVGVRVVSRPWRGQTCILELDAKKQLGGERTYPDMTVTFGAEVREEAVRTCADVPAGGNVMYEQVPANCWMMNLRPRPRMKCGQCRSVAANREWGREVQGPERLS